MKINHIYIKDKKRFFFSSFVWVSASTNQPCWNIEFSFTYLYTTSNNKNKTTQYNTHRVYIEYEMESRNELNIIIFYFHQYCTKDEIQ